MTATGDTLRQAGARLATQTVRHRSAGSLDAYGEHAHSTAAWGSYRAQVRRPTRRDLTLDADLKVAEWIVVIFDPDIQVGVTDELELPGGEVRPIMAVESRRVPESDEQWAVKVTVK